MSQYELTNHSYLSRHYFDDQRLKSFALSEFVRCMRSGRMTAFVGSMATVGLGYPNWAGLLDMGREAIQTILKTEKWDCDETDRLLNDFDKFWKPLQKEMKLNKAFDGRVVASAVGQWVDVRLGATDIGTRINEEIAKKLSVESDEENDNEGASILRELHSRLKIKRYITTNYDMEIEFLVSAIADKKTKERYNELNKRIKGACGHTHHRGAQLRLVLDDGNVLASDAFSRQRLDRLIEFSTDSADIDFHVFHIHGRFDQPETMLLSYRDYDRLYRQAGASKLPFDQALSMLYSTNPVIFVGLGMPNPN